METTANKISICGTAPIFRIPESIEKWEWHEFTIQPSEQTMQTDRALFNSIQQKPFALPILRFYQWQQPSVSYGRTQGMSEPLKKQYQEKGWNVVQRPTGGGLVLHEKDICFTLIWKKNNHIPWKILESYQLIHQWIQQTLNELQIQCSPAPQPETNTPQQNKWCFQQPVCYDLVESNKKIVGGAQWRDQNTAMHQGSIQILIPSEKIITFKSTFEKFFFTTLT